MGAVEVAARFLTVTRASAPFRITGVTVSGKKLLVTGEGFEWAEDIDPGIPKVM